MFGYLLDVDEVLRLEMESTLSDRTDYDDIELVFIDEVAKMASR